jgi:threonine synthase
MGLSLARYAGKEGIKCTVFISRSANREKMEKIRAEGAEIRKIDGDFNDSLTAAENYAQRNGSFVCGDYHYRKEGQKSLLFEIIEQMKYKPPDYIIVQVGNSTLLAAVFKGLGEFIRLGLIKRMSRLIAVQSSQCDPLVSAFKRKGRVTYLKPRTKADAIAVGYPTFGFEGLNALKATGGFAESISDSEIVKANELLYKSTGIKAELGGAAGFAGFLKLQRSRPELFRNKETVLIITGNNED